MVEVVLIDLMVESPMAVFDLYLAKSADSSVRALQQVLEVRDLKSKFNTCIFELPNENFFIKSILNITLLAKIPRVLIFAKISVKISRKSQDLHF